MVVATSSDRLRGAVRRLFILHVYQINSQHLAFRTKLTTSQCPLCAQKQPFKTIHERPGHDHLDHLRSIRLEPVENEPDQRARSARWK